MASEPILLVGVQCITCSASPAAYHGTRAYCKPCWDASQALVSEERAEAIEELKERIIDLEEELEEKENKEFD